MDKTDKFIEECSEEELMDIFVEINKIRNNERNVFDEIDEKIENIKKLLEN